jgi:hypothetical protein
MHAVIMTYFEKWTRMIFLGELLIFWVILWVAFDVPANAFSFRSRDEKEMKWAGLLSTVFVYSGGHYGY